MSLQNADVVVLAVDLFEPSGSFMAKEMAKIELEIDSALRAAHLLRNRYLVVIKNLRARTCYCLPCHDEKALDVGVDHAYRLARGQSINFAFLVIPQQMAPKVFAQVAISQALVTSMPGAHRA